MKDLIGCTDLELYHRYVPHEELGSFGFVGVYRGKQDPFDIDILIETFDFKREGINSDDADKFIGGDVQDWAKLVHPKIERLVDALTFGSDPLVTPIVVSTANSGIQLSYLISKMGNLSPRDTHRVFGDLVDALSYAHSKGVYHGNLSSEWVYIDSTDIENAAVTHWCLSLPPKKLEEYNLLSRYETRAYSPERLLSISDPDLPECPTQDGDVYSLAIIVFEMLTGSHPFLDFEDPEVYKPTSVDALLSARKLEDIQPMNEFGVEDDIAQVVLKGLSYDPEDRYPDAISFFDAFTQACGFDESPAVSVVHPDEPQKLKTKVDPVEPAKVVPAPEKPVSVLESDYPEVVSLSGAQAIASTDPSTFPSPKGRELVIALLLLIVTNIGWYLYISTGPYAAQTLPSAELIRVETDPSGATMTEILPSGEPHEIGKTPLTINLKEYARRQVRATFSKESYQDTAVAISSDGKQTTMVRVNLSKAE